MLPLVEDSETKHYSLLAEEWAEMLCSLVAKEREALGGLVLRIATLMDRVSSPCP